MKQQPSQFGQAFQISELRQQVAGLEEQNKKLTADIKNLRDTDRKIFDEQEAMIDTLKSLVKDFVTFATTYFHFWEEKTQVKNGLLERAQALLAEKES